MVRTRQRVDIPELADELVRLMGCLPHQVLDVGLTAGRDSRLIAALAQRAGVKARFFTGGPRASADVRIASALAERFGLEHHTFDGSRIVDESWPVVRDRLLAQGEGLVSLWQVQDVAGQAQSIDTMRVALWGTGGEIARGTFSHPKLFLAGDVPAYLHGRFGSRGLLTPDAAQLVRRELDAFIAEHPGDPLGLPDHFYAEERVRRWAGANMLKARATTERFSPYVTRPFIEAAFARPARRRIAESLHYDLLRHLDPALHAFPFEKPWRPQRFTVTRMLVDQVRARRRPVTKGPAPAIDERQAQLMDEALDQVSSPVWTVLSRPAFERLRRSPRRETVWNALTLFAHHAMKGSDGA